MQVSTEKINSYELEMTVEVDEKKFDEGIQHAYRAIATQVNIPGFRKGKVPRKVLEAHLGKEVFYDDAVDYLLPRIYPEALETLDSAYEPISSPDVELVQVEAGKPFIFKAKIQIKPEVKLGEYTGLELEKKNIEPTEEDVAAELSKLQDRHAEMIVLEDDEEIAEGDQAVIDYAGSISGELFEGGSAEGHNLEIGSKTFIPGFEEQLIGMKTDDEKTIEVTFPEDYHAEELSGKVADFKVKILAVKRKRLLELDDEFAKDISEFETLDELKEDIVKKVRERKEEEAENDLRIQAVRQIVETAEFDLPPAMVDNQVEFMLRDFEYNLQTQGISMDDFIGYTGTDIETIKTDYRPTAEQIAKEQLVMESLIKAEAIEVSEEEIDEELERLGKIYNQSADMLRQMFTEGDELSNVKENISKNKLFAMLISNAKIKELD